MILSCAQHACQHRFSRSHAALARTHSLLESVQAGAQRSLARASQSHAAITRPGW